MKTLNRALALIPVFAFLFSTPGMAAVEYVRICSLYGANYYYSPGSDSCVNAITGEVRTQTEFGLVRRQTYVTARVRALESWFCDGCFAVVRPNGTVTHSDRPTTVSRVSAGHYTLQFGLPVTQCAINATLVNTEADGVQPPIGVITAGRTPNSSDRGVSVWIYNMYGGLTDRGFNLSLDCPKKPAFCTIAGKQCTGNENIKGLGPEGP